MKNPAASIKFGGLLAVSFLFVIPPPVADSPSRTRRRLHTGRLTTPLRVPTEEGVAGALLQ